MTAARTAKPDVRKSQMNSPVAFTLDLEDHDPDRAVHRRYIAITEALLDDLDEWGVTGTVFVLGDLLDEALSLIRLIVERGHEVGLHGADHQHLPEVGPMQFRDATKVATESLASITGKPVLGFRAPTFSLIPSTAWAPEILAELGYVYSSSVLPARNPLFGWPGAPTEPFRWPCGLIELPFPMARIGALAVPTLGGLYLRVSPGPLVKWSLRRLHDHSAKWLYTHPYDFDPDEPRHPKPTVGRIGNRMMWWGRRRMRRRVRDLVSGSKLTMADIAARHADSAIFHPPETPNRS